MGPTMVAKYYKFGRSHVSGGLSPDFNIEPSAAVTRRRAFIDIPAYPWS